MGEQQLSGHELEPRTRIKLDLHAAPSLCCQNMSELEDCGDYVGQPLFYGWVPVAPGG